MHEKLNTEYYEFLDQGLFVGDYTKRVFPELLEALKLKLPYLDDTPERDKVAKQIETARLILRPPTVEDAASLEDFEARNRAHLAPWESSANELPDRTCHTRLSAWEKECTAETAARFFIFTKSPKDHLIGMCNFTQIFRGAFQACYVGYKIDQAYEGLGMMHEALERAIRYIFEELQLHRIMANYMPINLRSAKLLNRLGFAFEGYAKHYLQINGQWEDHVLTALSLEEWKASQMLEKASMAPVDALVIRQASLDDLDSIVWLYFDDDLGNTREIISNAAPVHFYVEAFAKICADPNSEVIVAEFCQKVIGVMQITYLRHLTFQGSLVAHIEGVRIHKEHQNKGFGKRMLKSAIERAKKHGCHRVQLMTDKRRPDAHAFYKQMGFTATHEGMKLLC